MGDVIYAPAAAAAGVGGDIAVFLRQFDNFLWCVSSMRRETVSRVCLRLCAALPAIRRVSRLTHMRRINAAKSAGRSGATHGLCEKLGRLLLACYLRRLVGGGGNACSKARAGYRRAHHRASICRYNILPLLIAASATLACSGVLDAAFPPQLASASIACITRSTSV